MFNRCQGSIFRQCRHAYPMAAGCEVLWVLRLLSSGMPESTGEVDAAADGGRELP